MTMKDKEKASVPVAESKGQGGITWNWRGHETHAEGLGQC